MIRAVRADRPSFHDVTFDPGFNVVLADRTKESTKTDSRNGLGKSTLLEIIHFCLGASNRGNPLLVDNLKDWTFHLDFTAAGRDVSASRTTSNSSIIAVEGDFTRWPLKPELSRDSGEMEFSQRQWNELLGNLLFGLPPDAGERNVPTFRGLISFFIRRGRDAYSVPFESHRKQVEAEKQIYNAFLLGLEWRDAADFQRLKDHKKTLEDLQKAAKQGLVKDFVGSRGELETLRVRLADKVRTEGEQLRTFRVHPEYEDLARNADRLTAEIHELTNANVVNIRYLELYRSTLAQEQPPADQDVASVYRRAGVELPGLVLERLEKRANFSCPAA